MYNSSTFQRWRDWTGQLLAAFPSRLKTQRSSPIARRKQALGGFECLEDRQLLSITSTVSYEYDTNNFFNTQLKKDVFEAAVDSIVGRFEDDLQAIVPGGNNSWTAVFFHPGTGGTQTIPNPVVQQDEVILYVGGRELGSTLGQGGPGGFTASGLSNWLTTIQTRGETGATGPNPTDFGPWGGSVAFDVSTNWHFGLTTSGLDAGETDFYSVAVHELSHLFGFGSSDSWDTYTDAGTQRFTGPASVAEYDGAGNVPLSPDMKHWFSSMQDGGQEAAMDPSLTVGTRKALTNLDYAGLADVGWDISSQSTEPEQVKLVATDPALADWFGYSVDIEGDLAVIGSKLDDDGGTNSGSAYIYQRVGETWTQFKKIVALDAEANDQFGHSVSISGDTIIVGAWIEDSNNINAGAAYVFHQDAGGQDNWGQVKKLTGSGTTPGDKFGWSVAIDGDVIVVGASEDDPVGSASGAVYIFERDQGGINNWGEVASLMASDGDALDRFGHAVDVDGTTVVIGARLADTGGTYSGSAYVFDRNLGGPGNWGQVTKIAPADLAVNDQFGQSVSLHGDYIAIGSWLDDYDQGAFRSNAGSVYVFHRNEGGLDNWGQITKSFADDPAPGNRVGTAVSLYDDQVLAGAMYDDDTQSNSGSAYVFQKDTGGVDAWGQLHKLVQSDPRPNDSFGISVALDGQTGLVGAYVGDAAVPNSGVAYVNNLQPGVGALALGGDAPLALTGVSEPQQAPLLPEGSPSDILDLKSVDDLFEQLGQPLDQDELMQDTLAG